MNELSPIGHNSGISVYNEFREQLADLENKNAKAAFDYEDPKGNKAARSHIYELRKTKGAVEKARKEEKAASLEYGRKVDKEAAEITAKIEAMIDVHQKPLDEIEQREAARIAKHEANLAEIEGAGRTTQERWIELPLEAMQDRLAEVEREPVDEGTWEEYAARAASAKATTLALMRDAITRRERHDAEQAELVRLRAEAEAREKADREEKLRLEGEERARLAAEKKAADEKAEAERKAAQAKADAERREREAAEREERLKAEAAESECKRIEAEKQAEQRAKDAAREAEARLLREQEAAQQRLRDETAKREANKRHRAKINNAAVAALVAGGITEDTAKAVITIIAQGSVPSVTITY